jgi:hypothetical protein
LSIHPPTHLSTHHLLNHPSIHFPFLIQRLAMAPTVYQPPSQLQGHKDEETNIPILSALSTGSRILYLSIV